MIIHWPEDLSPAAYKAKKELGPLYEVLSGYRIGGFNTDIAHFNKIGYKKTLNNFIIIFQEALQKSDSRSDRNNLIKEIWIITYAMTPTILSQIGWQLPDHYVDEINLDIENLVLKLLPRLKEKWQKNYVAEVLFLLGNNNAFTFLNTLDNELHNFLVNLIDRSILIHSHRINLASNSTIQMDQIGFLSQNFLDEIKERKSSIIVEFIANSYQIEKDIKKMEYMCKMLLLLEHPNALNLFFSLVNKTSGIFFKTQFLTDQERQEYTLSKSGLPERGNFVFLISPLEHNFYQHLFLQRLANSTYEDYSRAFKCKFPILRWLALKSINNNIPINGTPNIDSFKDTKKLFLFKNIKSLLNDIEKDNDEYIRIEVEKAISLIDALH